MVTFNDFLFEKFLLLPQIENMVSYTCLKYNIKNYFWSESYITSLPSVSVAAV